MIDGDRWGKDNEGTQERMRRSKENKGLRWMFGCKEQLGCTRKDDRCV
jgi:hypothetical protein